MKTYLILDTETATLPFVKAVTKGDDKKTSDVATKKPLVYDIAWHKWNEVDGVHDKQHFIISDIYDNKDLFETAYYKAKRPLYEEAISKGEVIKTNWDTAVEALIKACGEVDIATAFNAEFDFKKAIPFTDLYIRKSKSPVFYEWLKGQRLSCEWLVKTDAERNKESKTWKKTETILPANSPKHHNFEIRGHVFPMGCIYVQSCMKWLANDTGYKTYCLERGKLFRTINGYLGNAECVFQYLTSNPSFKEDHMAYSDVCIETDILKKLLSITDIKTGLDVGGVPLRFLGHPEDLCVELKNKEYAMTMMSKGETYLSGSNVAQSKRTEVQNIINRIEDAMKGW